MLTTAPMAVRIASYVVFGEAIALLGIALFYVVETLVASPTRIFGALGGAGLALAGSAVFAGLAVALKKQKPRARAPIIVLEALCLPVGSSLAFQAGQWGYGLIVLLPALTVLGALATPIARRSFVEQSQVDKAKNP